MPRAARPWFRFYSEALESRKVFMLGREDPALFTHWVYLLCLANHNEERGLLPPRSADIAHALRVNEPEVGVIIDALIRRGFIDKVRRRLYMHDWDDWQFLSDINKTPGRATKNEARGKRGGSRAVPRSMQGVEAEADTEADTETDTETEQNVRASLGWPEKSEDSPDSFREIYRRKYEGSTGKPIAGDRMLVAGQLEKRFGSAACIQVAEVQGWEKHPRYYEGRLSDTAGRLSAPEPTDGGISAEHERLGLGRPPVYVARNPYRDYGPLDAAGNRNG